MTQVKLITAQIRGNLPWIKTVAEILFIVLAFYVSYRVAPVEFVSAQNQKEIQEIKEDIKNNYVSKKEYDATLKSWEDQMTTLNDNVQTLLNLHLK